MIISESTSNLFSALIKARVDIETVIKDKAGYGYNYATLDNVITMLKKVLPNYDLGFAQFPETVNGKDGVTTIVMHKSGEYMSARYEMEATEMKGTNLTQQKGASITYARRYALCSVFGIPTEEDTDGDVRGYQVEEQSSVEDIIKGIKEKMNRNNWKGFYKRAIELYPKGTDEYTAWISAFNETKAILENTGSSPSQYIEDVNFLKEI